MAKNPDQILKLICDRIGIKYLDGQKNYWNKKHNTLFGSSASRIHLHDTSSSEYHRLKDSINAKQIHKKVSSVPYRTIKYNKPDTNKIPAQVIREIESRDDVKTILKLLTTSDVSNVKVNETDLSAKPPKPDPLWYLKLKAKLIYQRLNFLFSKKT